LIGDESRTLVDHSGLDVLVVRGETSAGHITNKVVVYTQVNGLAHVLRADCDVRVIDRTHEACRRFSEESNGRNMVGNLGRHRRRHF
jgi:hypothetical protein